MESSPLSPVAATRPVAPYVGGKRNLAREIVARIQAVPHTLYAEPFVGMGGIFLRRTARPRAEVINDYSGDVATFFRILQRHYVPFMEMLRFQLTTRAEFERLTATDPDTLTDLERAARFFYLQVTAFGGKVVGRNFGMARDRPARFDINRLGPMLEDVHARLAEVSIERLPFAEFIARYDHAGALFYCDPPYWGTEDYYGEALFSREDFARLSDSLRRLKGRFMVSLNDTAEVRDLFAWAQIERLQVTYTLSAKATAPVGEVLITSP